ncbi:MAG: hypothetical protein NXY59_02950 [Aigarchaeota archaeon]|nr:hypothetical protein [Candidatus Pelearchaeum maunauluense]
MRLGIALPAIIAAVLVAAALLAMAETQKSGMVVVTIPRGVAHLPYIANYWPPTIKVVIGINNSVKWINMDDHMHTVTSDNWSFHSGELNLYDSFIYTFTKPGVYGYSCMPHPWMRGYVEVREA